MKAASRILALGIAIVLSATATFAADEEGSGWMTPIQYWRAYDQSGINVFETSKDPGAEFNGLGVRIGGGFSQGYQLLSHENSFGKSTDDGSNLYGIGNGFNNAQANLYIDGQLADGVRLNLTLYLSSRHHTETWVKGGFLQIDKLGFLNSAFLDDIMEYLTIRVGHMEVNYGDAHFRRTDGGNAMYNPFVENYLVDAFTTEIGFDVAFQTSGFIALVGVTNGEIKGNVNAPDPEAKDITPAIYGKLGWDGNVAENIRLRATGSIYTQGKSPRNTLFAGDRTGSHYWGVMDPAGANLTSSAFRSGRLNPNLSDHLTAFAINVLLDVGLGNAGAIELFGNYDMATGNDVEADALSEEDRSFSQIAVDLIYRIGASRDVFVGVRYNTVTGNFMTDRNREDGNRAGWYNYDTDSWGEQSVDRLAIGAGWFILDYVLLKGEYVMQNYNDWTFNNGNANVTNAVNNQGKFNGVVIEAVVGF